MLLEEIAWTAKKIEKKIYHHTCFKWQQHLNWKNMKASQLKKQTAQVGNEVIRALIAHVSQNIECQRLLRIY